MQEEIIAFLGVARNRVAADTFRAVLTFHGTVSSTPSPFQFAAYHGLVHIMKTLLNQGADMQGELLLIAAAQGGHLDMVKLLLSQAGVNVNQVDPKKKITPLIEAAGGQGDLGVKAHEFAEFSGPIWRFSIILGYFPPLSRSGQDHTCGTRYQRYPEQ